MATLMPGTPVQLDPAEAAKLRFGPPAGLRCYVAVHPDALKSGGRNLLTLVAGVALDDVEWVGAVDEGMLRKVGGLPEAHRPAIARRLLVGGSLWTVWRPDLLTNPGIPNPLLTVYDRDRPWIVIGALANGSVLAAPLNDAAGNPKWWTPVLTPAELGFAGAKSSQVELAHLWSLPVPAVGIGTLAQSGSSKVTPAVLRYYQQA